MKKALYVATVDVHINTFHLPYLKLLQDNGYEVHVATGEGGSHKHCDKKYQISIKRSPYSFSNIKAIKQLKEIINKEHYDLIHCHTPMGAVVARIASKEARKKGTRVIYTAHGYHFFKGAPLSYWLMFYPIEKYLAKYTDTLININKEDYNRSKSKFYKRCKDIVYIPGVGIDTNRFVVTMTPEEKHNYRASLGLKDDDIVLIFIARLDKNKNQGLLIDVVKELSKEYNNIKLVLAGNDELNGYYQNMAKEKGVLDKVIFLGNRQDVPELLYISDILVSSSKREGLPVGIMEGLAAGKPIVAINCRGMEDLIEDDVNGNIVNNLDEFINKIDLLVQDKDLINKYSINNINKSKYYDISNIVNQVKKVYKI